MKDLLRNVGKGIAAILITMTLIGLGGLWRLATHPLHITHSSFLTKYLPPEFGFQDIYLRAHAYYTLPEIQVIQATYTTPEFTLRTPTLYASWNIFSLLRGNFNVSVVTLDQPEITIRSTDTSDKPFLDTINEALSKIPLKYLAIENGTLSITDAQQKTWRLERTFLYMLRLLRKINISGSSHILGLARPVDVAFRGGLHSVTGEYEGTVKIENLVLDALPIDDPDVQSILKHYASPINAEFYVHMDPRKTPDSAPHMEWSGHLRFQNTPQDPAPLQLSGTWMENGPLSLRFRKAHMSLDQLKDLWPPLVPSVKEWLIKHVKAVQMSDVDLRLGWITQSSKLIFSQLKGSADLAQGIAQPIPTLPPFKHLSGTFTFDQDKAQLALKTGTLETIQLNSSIIDLKWYNSNAPTRLHLTLNAKGPLTGLDTLLRAPDLCGKIPYSIRMKSGTFTVEGSAAFPLVNPNESTITYALKGNISQGKLSIKSPSKQKYLFDQTQLTYDITPTQRDLHGSSTINGLSVQFHHQDKRPHPDNITTLTSAKGSGSVNGLLALLPSAVTSQVLSPKGGKVGFNVMYEETQGKTSIKGHADFTSSTLAIPLLQWTKAKDQPGTVDIDLRLRQGALESLKQLDIKAKGLVVHGNAQFDPTTNRLYKVTLDPFQINGASAKGTAEFKNNIWSISFKAPYIRLDPLLKMGQGASKSSGQSFSKASPTIAPRPAGYNINVEVPNVLMAKGFSLKNLKSFIKIRDNVIYTLMLEAMDEDKPITILYRPQGQDMMLDLKLPRIENFLQGLNITDQVRAEGITIQATKPLKHMNTSIKGKLFIDKIYIQKAPAFAKLLSLVSISGLINALQDKGLVFTDNYAKFEYLDQKVALRRSRVMNGSIGITAVGIIDLKEKTLNIQGVLVPANFFSQLIGKIPILGNLLTGGKDKGLFSVSYGASGSFSDPKIKSNPLGLLAPNIVKNLFEGITKGKSEKPTLRSAEINDAIKKNKK